jgi:hypothetical protein
MSDVLVILSSVHSAEQCGSLRPTEGHSFGDHLINAVLHHQVLQKLPAIVLCSVSLRLVWDTI